jgi:hypothetical protein
MPDFVAAVFTISHLNAMRGKPPRLSQVTAYEIRILSLNENAVFSLFRTGPNRLAETQRIHEDKETDNYTNVSLQFPLFVRQTLETTGANSTCRRHFAFTFSYED